MTTDKLPGAALITGASRGIGRAIAERMAARGLRLAIHCRTNRKAAQDFVRSLPGTGHALITADLTEPEAAAQLWRSAAEKIGPLDVLVNNAAIYLSHPPLITEDEAWQAVWRQTHAVNLIAPAVLSRLAARSMAARTIVPDAKFGRGRIVSISSRAAFRGEPDAPAYGASKAGLNSFSQSLAKALAPRQIYVFSVAPGWVDTEMAAASLRSERAPEILAQHPLGRVALPDEVANAVVYCALDAPPTMTGCIIDVNGASYLRN